MKEPNFLVIVIIVVCSSLMLLAGLFLLAKFNSLFKRHIKNELLRKNVVVWLIAICLILTLTPTRQEFYQGLTSSRLMHYFFVQLVAVTIEALFVFNVVWLVIQYLNKKGTPFRMKMGISLFIIIVSCMLIGIPLNYFGNGNSFKNFEFGLIFNFYVGCMTGLVYITMSYVDLERTKKMNEKELEVSRLRELKTKAELDALHSKINPHFLYNALNSIADLSITDGRKARNMTIALADLFRYSINYSQNNYSTISDEVAMTEVYLQIEKIRFEDKLTYSIRIDEEAKHYLVPRFILQPLVENAVKHGLKATGQMTEILLEIKLEENKLLMNVADNGPMFPEDLVPGYGVKSVYDKLDLLFPNQYEIHFHNQPHKMVSIHLQKLMKNEPAV
jgi:sensor histidine kinase YesM